MKTASPFFFSHFQTIFGHFRTVFSSFKVYWFFLQLRIIWRCNILNTCCTQNTYTLATLHETITWFYDIYIHFYKKNSKNFLVHTHGLSYLLGLKKKKGVYEKHLFKGNQSIFSLWNQCWHAYVYMKLFGSCWCLSISKANKRSRFLGATIH